MKWDHDMPEVQRDGQKRYIDDRWKQLSNLQMDFEKEAMKYLFLINSGASVATLAFIGTATTVRSEQWAWSMLAFFAAGVILIGLTHIARIYCHFSALRRH